MHQKEDFILRTWPFLLVTFMYVIVGMTLNKYYGEEALHIVLNKFNFPIADFFFKYFTKTGELIFGLFILVFIVWKSSWRMLITFISAALLQSLIIVSSKRLFFVDHHRPGFYFKEKAIDIHLVDGIKQGITFTFPSGHTATAFFLFLILTLLVKNNWLKFFFGIAAVFAALSRIYLSQHFMQDTVAGGLIGILSVIFSYYFWLNKNLPFLNGQVRKIKS